MRKYCKNCGEERPYFAELLGKEYCSDECERMYTENNEEMPEFLTKMFKK